MGTRLVERPEVTRVKCLLRIKSPDIELLVCVKDLRTSLLLLILNNHTENAWFVKRNE